MRLSIEGARVELGGRTALKSASADFHPGALTGVIGPNGAGKTTLLRALAGLLPLAAGSVSLDGAPVGTLDRRETARRVGYLAQSHGPAFPFRVEEAVAMGRYPHQGRLAPETAADREAVDAALRDADADGLRERLVTELSGGELQRVLIARTLAARTPVLLLDEPFASLDVRHSLDVLRILRAQAREGRAVVVSAHDLNLAQRFCDVLLLLHEGEILAHGEARSVLRPALIERAFQVRVRVLRADGEPHFVMRALEEERPEGEA